MTYIRVRLYGSITDLSIIASLANVSVGESCGLGGRWTCDDPPIINGKITHPILDLTTRNATAAAQLDYNIRGISHLSITNSSELASHDVVVDIRQGLTTHFYATFFMECGDNQTPLVVPDHDLIDQAIWELTQIDLYAEECIIQTVVPDACYKAEVAKIADGYSYAAASITSNHAIVAIDDASSRKIVIVARSSNVAISDESVWYKYWQCRSAYRELLLQASELSEKITPLLDEASHIPISHKSSKKIARQGLAVRANVVEATDMLRSYTLMSGTLRRFRDQLMLDERTTTNATASPFKGEFLWSKILHEEQRLYIQPLNAVETAVGQLIDSAESRLASLESIQQAAFNYQIQRQLRTMQIIAIVIAMLGLYGIIR